MNEYSPAGADKAADIIRITSLPVILDTLDSVKAQIENNVSFALSLAVCEETRAEVKKKRAELNKEREQLDKCYKEAMAKVLAPINAIEEKYNACKAVYKEADEKIAERIKAVETGLKDAKAEAVREYFDELTAAEGLDFLRFEDVPIKVNLSVSEKKLKEETKAFVEGVGKDVSAIQASVHSAEVMAEYKSNGYSLTDALNVVNSRHRAIEQEKQRLESLSEKEKKEHRKFDEAFNAVRETAEEALQAPTETAANDSKVENEADNKLYTLVFKARGSKIALSEFKRRIVQAAEMTEGVEIL